MTHRHVGCGGELTFSERKRVVISKGFKIEDGKRVPNIKQLDKDLYLCDKCKRLVSCILFPSWEQYVLMGKIRVAKHVYWNLKKRYKR